MDQSNITQSYGDFRIDIEGRLATIESELSHKAAQEDVQKDIANLKIWAITGACTGAIAFVIVLLGIIANMAKVIVDLLKI